MIIDIQWNKKEQKLVISYVDKLGNRHEKYFATTPEARNWIEESKYADKH